MKLSIETAGETAFRDDSRRSCRIAFDTQIRIASQGQNVKYSLREMERMICPHRLDRESRKQTL
jgi:hypothetical protein